MLKYTLPIPQPLPGLVVIIPECVFELLCVGTSLLLQYILILFIVVSNQIHTHPHPKTPVFTRIFLYMNYRLLVCSFYELSVWIFVCSC